MPTTKINSQGTVQRRWSRRSVPHYSESRCIGHDLTPADLRSLEMRWTDPDLARRAGLRRVDSLTDPEVVGRKGGNYSGTAIPYFHLGSE
jgi:hypothetical protein